MPYDPHNVFAKILNGEVACHKVYEDDDAIAFMDFMPQSLGHTQVVPKAPSQNLLDADPVVLSKVIPLVQKVAIAAKSAFDADGISIVQWNGSSSGQTVFHLHFHVIPSFVGQETKSRLSRSMESDAVLADHAEKLRAAMSSRTT